MKTNGTFKLSKSSKRILATFVDPHKRGDFKRFAIQCEYAEQRAKFAKVDKSNKE
jgi:hypothetical protein